MNDVPMAPNAGTIRRMAEMDLDAGLRLSEAAGWDQRRADWALFYRANPGGCFVAEREGQVVGTVTSVDYAGRLAWIAMMLVDAECRGRGIGTGLMQAAMRAVGHCACIKLDATPAGKPMYDRLGFVEEHSVGRFLAAKAPQVAGVAALQPRPMQDDDVDRVVALDAEAFGIERRVVMDGLRAMAREYAIVLEAKGEIAGFCLGRHGRRFEHLGPLIATGLETANALAVAAFANAAGKPIVMDVPHQQGAWIRWIESLGFREQRAYTRMYRGQNISANHPAWTFAIAGAEFG